MCSRTLPRAERKTQHSRSQKNKEESQVRKDRKREGTCLNRYGERKQVQTKMKDERRRRHVREAPSTPKRMSSGKSTPSTPRWKHKAPSQRDLKAPRRKDRACAKGGSPDNPPGALPGGQKTAGWDLEELEEKSRPAGVDSPPQHLCSGERGAVFSGEQSWEFACEKRSTRGCQSQEFQGSIQEEKRVSSWLAAVWSLAHV